MKNAHKLNKIFFAFADSIVNIYDNDVHEITLSQINKLKKCKNINLISLAIKKSIPDNIINELFNIETIKLAIRVVSGKINVPKNVTNKKLQELMIDVEKNSEITLIPKEILDKKLKTLGLGGLIILEKANYFPNLFTYDHIIIIHNTHYINYLYNGEEEMCIDVLDKISMTGLTYFDDAICVPENIKKLKIKLPFIHDDNSKNYNLVTKIMNNLPNSLEILILNMSLPPFFNFFTNLPVGLKELHLNEIFNPLLEDIKTQLKIPFDTKIIFY